MTLAPGARLGPYQIVAPLGAGGMGEVFRARDTRLGREVAVKVLPGGAAADPEGAMRRLEYPIGKLLYETAGWISGVRVSPDGGRVAFWHHPTRGDNLASLDVIDVAGKHDSLGNGAASAGIDDIPIRWTADGKGLYLQRGPGVPGRIDLLDVASGKRRPWKELAPPDPAGVLTIGPILLSDDGQSYVYSYRRMADDLYLVEGLR